MNVTNTMLFERVAKPLPVRPPAVNPIADPTKPEPPTLDPTATVAGDEAAVATATDKTDGREKKVPGVIRKLESGHFKGVADIRLRINFHDQLAARAADRRDAAVTSGAKELVHAVGSGIEKLETAMGMDDDGAAAVTTLMEEFATDVGTAATTGDAGTIDIDGIRVGFQTLTDGLRALFASPPATPTPVEPVPIDATPVPLDAAPREAADEAVSVTSASLDELASAPAPAPTEDAVAVTPDGVESMLADLEVMFDEALAGLLDAMHAANDSMAGPASEPSGHGRAYAKFMAIYEQMTGGPHRLDATG